MNIFSDISSLSALKKWSVLKTLFFIFFPVFSYYPFLFYNLQFTHYLAPAVVKNWWWHKNDIAVNTRENLNHLTIDIQEFKYFKQASTLLKYI